MCSNMNSNMWKHVQYLFKICLYHISHNSIYNNYNDLLLQRNIKHYPVTQGCTERGMWGGDPPPPIRRKLVGKMEIM